MKSDGLLKHFALALIIALVLYALAYSGIEHRRTRKGPWQVAFTNDVSGAPALLINQPFLSITNVQIAFAGATLPKDFSAETLAFDVVLRIRVLLRVADDDVATDLLDSERGEPAPDPGIDEPAGQRHRGEAAVEARSKELLDLAKTIWPRPEISLPVVKQ